MALQPVKESRRELQSIKETKQELQSSETWGLHLNLFEISNLKFEILTRPSTPYLEHPSRTRILIRLKRLRHHLPIRLLQKYLDPPLSLLKLLLTFPRKRNPLLKKLHSLIKRKVSTLQTLHNFLKPPKRLLKI